MKKLIFFIAFVSFGICEFILSNSVDLSYCKLTHMGTEYVGRVSRTETNVTCQYWNSATQPGSENINDETFPDGSKVHAKNYCRNPNNNPNGPWCFTTKKNLIYDTCNVPLCKNTECRVSGTGMEYIGLIQTSVSGKKCTKWKDKHKMAEKNMKTNFKDRFFPDDSVSQAGRQCRNPDADIAGPWCFVEDDYNDLHKKELCDVPFCDDSGTIMYSEGSFSGQYYFFSNINSTQSLRINFRLWNPADWLNGQIFLYLSVFDVALDRQDIATWNSGIEFLISHQGSGILSSKEDDLQLMKTPLILSGAKWTEIEITWINPDNSSVLVQAFQKPKAQPFVITEVFTRGTVFEVETFRFFSVAGSPSLWNIPTTEDECMVHTISQMNFTRFWFMKKTTMGIDVEIFVRAKRNANIVMRSAPTNDSRQIQITIGDRDRITVITYMSNNHPVQIAETSWPSILNFWKWEYFKLTMLKEKLQVFWVRESSTELLIEATHPNVAGVLWVTFASPRISYWTIYCDPRGIADPPPPKPPECISQNLDLFNGSLEATESGKQCIPWIDKASIDEKYNNDDLFNPYGGRTTCLNFCRNLDKDPQGAYCFVRDSDSDTSFIKEYCHPRSCRLGDCKMAGTGNDYLGTLNVTRSKRSCKVWTEIGNDVVNINNFPDPSLEDAQNFCRNPSKSISGCWCYTSDPKILRDSCYIKDCDKPLECTVLTSGFLRGTFMYILPSWRKYGLEFWLKAWNPDLYEGLIILLKSKDESKEYILFIGDEDNEKVKLYYRFESEEILLEHKTLPHLVPSGKWGGYWIRPGFGKVELGYNGVKNSFFEWSSLKGEHSFEPMYLSFGTIHNHWIGVNFRCTECLVESVSIKEQNKIYPINLWKEDKYSSNLKLNIRGMGSAIVTLMWTPDFNRSVALKISSDPSIISLLLYLNPDESEILASYPVISTLFAHEWSEFIISYTEESITVHKDGEHLLSWPSSFPLLFYWFSVAAEEGTIIWSANCFPPDIDGEPRDGNWGSWRPWSCSVTCGKGVGRIERSCDNPPPNVFGKECKGSAVYEGPCNDFPCGEISPDTYSTIRHYLSSHHTSLQVDDKERVFLPCNPQLLPKISKEVYEMNISWTHNGMPCSRTKFRVDENYNLIIPHAHEKHNGVYLCVAFQGPDSIPSKIVLEAISLVVVKQKPTKKIRKGRNMVLKCNGLALSYVYADLSQRWELNGSTWKDYGIGALEMLAVDKLEYINDSHGGVWTCVIIQEDFKFKWITNWINLKVKSAPSFWSNLMEDVATAPIFGKLNSERNAKILFFSLLAVFVGVLVTVTALLVKWLTK